MITILDTGREARAFSDETITVECSGLPIRLVLSEEARQEVADCDPSGEIRIDVQPVSDPGEAPAMVLTASGTSRPGVRGACSGVTAHSASAEVFVVEGSGDVQQDTPAADRLPETKRKGKVE